MAQTRGEIGVEQAGLGSVLKNYTLIVPPNQREYSWTDREVLQLYRDIAKAIGDGDEDYFLGTLVTIPRPNGTLEVVDGQQRLATTAVLLAAIRDHLLDLGEGVIVESINNEFLTGIDRTKRERISKLRLNSEDNDLFSWIVSPDKAGPQPPATRNSHERLRTAYDLAKQHSHDVVAGLDPKTHGDTLERWVSFVQNHAQVELLRVPDDSDAYKMFETLNDRGLRTSQVDLIKNYLFGRSGSRIGEAQERWTYMRGTLESLEDDDLTVNFLRHSLIAQQGYLREVEVYEVVQRLVRSEQTAVSFASTLESLALAYVATFNPEHDRWNNYPPSVRRAIEVFNLLDIKPWRPLLLAVASKMKPREAADTFNFLVSLGVRLLVASSTRSGSVELPLAETARRVYAGELQSAASVRTALDPITPTDGRFRAAMTDTRVSSARLARYYLRCLETAARGEDQAWFLPVNDHSVVNLEHVLPKKQEGNWPAYDDESARSYCTRLGNLALMSVEDNYAGKSDAFTVKKPLLSKSAYLLTSMIGDAEDWLPADIDARQARLADLALSAWPVPPSPAA